MKNELSNPYAEQPAFAVGDRVKMQGAPGEELFGEVVKVYQGNDTQGKAMWFFDVLIDGDAELGLPPLRYITHAWKVAE